MRKWFAASALCHILLVILLWLGLPQLNKPLPAPPVLIPVEIAELAPMSAAKTEEKKEEPKEPQKEPPKPPEIRPEPPKPEVKPEPPKPEIKPEPPKPEPKPPEPKAEAIPLPKAKPKPPELKPKPEPKPDPLASILKNVAKLKPDQKQEVKKPVEKPAEAKPTPPPTQTKPATSAPSAPQMADKLTISEEDALRQQIRGCWNVPVGARDIENITVEVYIQVNPDRTLKDAIIVDQARLSRDSFFRAVAESALRALRNPRCSPLALPPEKYQQWQETIFNFNPKDMF